MKKYLFLMAIVALVFAACDNGNDTNLPGFNIDDLKGEWLLKEVNGEKPYTDDIFVIEFAELTQTYSVMIQSPEGLQNWNIMKGYTYKFDEDFNLVIESENTYLKVEVLMLTPSYLTYEVIEYSIGGEVVDEEIGLRFSFIKTSETVNVLGVWYGEIIINVDNEEVSEDFDIEFFADGTYNYKCAAFEQTGDYLLYDNFLVCNFTTQSVIPENTEHYPISEAWKFTSTGSTSLGGENYSSNGYVKMKLDRPTTN